MKNKSENPQPQTAELEKNPSDQADSGSNVTYCEICNIRLTSHGNYLQHVRGRKHKKKVSQLNVTKEVVTKKVVKKKATKRKKMNSTEKLKSSSLENNISTHISRQNSRSSSSKNQRRKSNLRYFGNYPDYSDDYYNSGHYQTNDSAYESHSNYGYWEDRTPNYSSSSYDFEYHQNVFGHREHSFDQHLNNSVDTSLDASFKTSNTESSCTELVAKPNDLSCNSGASITNSAISKSKCSSTSKLPSNSTPPLRRKSFLNFKPSSGSKATSPFNKIAKLKMPFSSPEALKDSRNLSEISDGEKVEQNLADKLAHNATRFVYPSTQKDKAVVGQLLNQLHRSKKKQNLTRLKIQSGCLDITERNNALKENIKDVNSDSVQKEAEASSGTSEDTNRETNLHQSNKPEGIRMDSSLQEVTVCKNKNKSKNKSSESNDLEITLAFDNNTELPKKRKRNDSHSKSPKIQRCSDINCFDNAINQAVVNTFQSEHSFILTSGTSHFQNSMLGSSVASNVLDSSNFQDLLFPSALSKDKTVTDPVLFGSEVLVKAEPLDVYEEQSKSSELQNTSLPMAISSVDSLINLFASGSVKVKQEYDDPLIDVIKSVDPSELVKACGNDPAMKQMSNLIESNFLSQAYQTDVIKRPILNPENTVKVSNNISNPKSLDAPNMLSVKSQSLCDESQSSADINEKSDDVSERLPVVAECTGNKVQQPDVSQASLANEEVANSNQELDTNSKTLLNSSETFPKESSELLKTVASECDMNTAFPHMEDLVKELKTLSSTEADIKKNLLFADEKIAEHQRILEEWKSKKLQYQTKEEELRMKRNNVIQLMQVVLGKKSEFISFPMEISLSSSTESIADIVANCNPENSSSLNNIPEEEREVTRNMTDPVQSDTNHHSSEEMDQTSDDAPESEPDVCILDSVQKKSNVPVIDLEAENQEQIFNRKYISKYGKFTQAVASSKQNIFDLKSFPAHQTVVNYLKVHGDYLYTCCNDSTAKRFCLYDITDVVTYNHTDKNVSQLCVDKIFSRTANSQGQVVVFTLCSGNNIVSLFGANKAKLLKTYHHINKINCICTGWNLCYVALSDGSVIALNLEEEREIIKSYTGSLVCLATAHQGGIRVLVTLSASGVISIHNAETGLLIRCLKDILRPPAHMSVYSDYAYFSSINKISILNISTGAIERKISLNTPVTGLVVDQDYIFTSTFSGAIQCYAIKKDRNVKPNNIASFKAVTCIDVYQNWIFIGNRNGAVDVIKFPTGQQNVFDRNNT